MKNIKEEKKEIIYICNTILGDANRTHLNRVLFLCKNYTVHIFARKRICSVAYKKASSVYVLPSYLLKWLFPFWVIKKVYFNLKTYNNKIIYSTYEPITLITAYWVHMLGMKWVADIYDDPKKIIILLQQSKNIFSYIKLCLRWIEYGYAKILLKKADLVVTLIKTEVEQNYFVRKDKILHITNGVNLSVKFPKSVIKEESPFTIIYVGTVETMRLRNVPDILYSLYKKIGFFKFICIGYQTNNGYKWLNNKVQAKCAEIALEIKGVLPYEEVLQNIAQAHVCICPYPNIGDLNPAYPIKIFDYMAMGKPIVATRLRGIKEILQDGVDGFLVAPNSSEEMAQSLAMLKENPKLCEKLSLAAKRKVRQYDWDIIHAKVLPALNNIILK